MGYEQLGLQVSDLWHSQSMTKPMFHKFALIPEPMPHDQGVSHVA